MAGSSRARPRLSRIQVQDFRNYAGLDLAVEADIVAFAGENGAGKTNLLEAISFLAPGRGLRRAGLDEAARVGGSGGWAVAATVDTHDGEVAMGTGLEPGDTVRKYRLERASVPSAMRLAEHIRVIWLTPAQDGLFSGTAGERRRYLDRLVLAVDPQHGSRVNALERALRNRNRLLEDDRHDPAWASAIEREIAETGVAVAAARFETIARLAALIERHRGDDALFPHALIALDGEIERRAGIEPSATTEDWFRERLRETRSRDRAAGRTLTGPQTCDLKVRHGPKDIEAERASTGEQKALLIGLMLAHARLVEEMTGIAPIMLLDEVAAHLDLSRRQALYARLAASGAQVFMTGTDRSLFEGLGPVSVVLTVESGRVEAREDRTRAAGTSR